MMPVLLLLAMGSQDPSASAIAHIKAGISADQQGRPAAAIAEFKRAADLAPDFAPAFVDLGVAYMKENRYADAVAPLEKAQKLNPGIPGVEKMLGYAWLFQGYAARAIPCFEAADEQGGLGIAQVETGDLTDAVVNLQAALKQQPTDPDLLFYMAKAAGLLSKQAGDALLAADPNTARAHQALAENYWALQRYADADKEYRTALQISPDLEGLHLALGKLYERQQDPQKAESEYRAEAQLRPGSAEAAYRLGETQLANGELSQAAAELKRANALRPDMPETLYALGKAESLSGDAAGAEKAWTRLLALEKNSDLAAKAHFGLAGIYRKQGRTAEAAREMQEFEALNARPSGP